MKALDTIKNAFFYLITIKNTVKALGFLFQAEIDYRKRLFFRSYIFIIAGGAFFMGGILSFGYLMFLIIERYIQDVVISAAVITFAFLLLGSLSLYAGDRFLNRLLSIDWDKVKKNIL